MKKKNTNIAINIPDDLTDLQREFLQIYLTDPEVRGNKTQSYLKVRPQLTPATAKSNAIETLRKPAIASYLQELKAATTTATVLSMIESREILTKIARTEPDETTRQGDRINAIKADAEIGGYKASEKVDVQFLGILADVAPPNIVPDGGEVIEMDDD